MFCDFVPKPTFQIVSIGMSFCQLTISLCFSEHQWRWNLEHFPFWPFSLKPPNCAKIVWILLTQFHCDKDASRHQQNPSCIMQYPLLHLLTHPNVDCTVQWCTIQWSAVQWSAVKCSTVQWSAVKCSTVQWHGSASCPRVPTDWPNHAEPVPRLLLFSSH